MDEKKEIQTPEAEGEAKPELAVDEFSIVELEDRLEMAAVSCCNNNCSCPAPT